ncbi:MAG: hypothetical protein ACLR8P_10430 [Clostridium fessum]
MIPGMIGCMQAAEVLKLLLGKGEPLIGKMLFIDAKTWSTDLIEVPVHPQCSCLCTYQSSPDVKTILKIDTMNNLFTSQEKNDKIN